MTIIPWKAQLLNIKRIFSRKKPLTDSTESKLAKVLSTFDLTALGIGSTLGVGIYVIAGDVSKTMAGPAVVISFMIAAIASIFAGLCYAEFGARVPKAGSAYVYSYVTIGEFIAFIIGWNLILEYAIGSASVVKGLSNYLDSLLGDPMKTYMSAHVPMHASGLSDYPDFFALAVTLVFSVALAFGAKESSFINNIFTMCNLAVVLFVVIAGLFKVDAKNWQIPESEVPPNFGTGGFAPYGFSGIIKGAAVCFYGFIGFDCIATAGEEAKNPRKSIPLAVCISLGMIFLAYFSVSTVLTMMLPYYSQNENAPLPYVFRQFEWVAAEYIVSIGAMFGLCASLMGSMFPLPRIVFAMASDGLLFKFMGKIHPKYKTPFIGTLLTGSLTGFLAAIFNLSQLVNMMSIGTLLAYSMVAGCVLILRYKNDDKIKTGLKPKDELNVGVFRQLFNLDHLTIPTKMSSRIVRWSIILYCIWCFFLSAVVSEFEEEPEAVTTLYKVLVGIAACLVLVTLIIISRQPVSSALLSFKVPLVPWLPGLSILINIYLMLKLDYMTWVRFAVWIVVGLVIYFVYGIRNSKEKLRLERKEENARSNSIANIYANGLTITSISSGS